MIIPTININDIHNVYEIKKLENTLKNTGFFLIKEHDIDHKLIEKVFEVSRNFFDLSDDVKNKVRMKPDYPYGYENAEILSQSYDDNVVSEKKKDSKETFQICLNYKNIIWPKQPYEMQDIFTTYYEEVLQLCKKVLNMLTVILDVPVNWFDDKIDNHQSVIRSLNYPKLNDKTNSIRATPHTDYGVITFLTQYDVGGLQVKYKDTWIDVEIPKNGYVVNIGDMMMRWSNDNWKSTLHQVINNSGHRRQSLAYFFNLNDDAIVEVFNKYKTDKCYEPVIAGEYLMKKHFDSMSYST